VGPYTDRQFNLKARNQFRFVGQIGTEGVDLMLAVQQLTKGCELVRVGVSPLPQSSHTMHTHPNALLTALG
jgi:hypothetical protein